MMKVKKNQFLIVLFFGMMSYSFNSSMDKNILATNKKCSTDWIVDSLNIQIGISNCFSDSDKYELIVVAKDYFKDTIYTKFYEIGEVSYINVMDKMSLSKRRFILKDGIIAIPVKSFSGLKICFVDLKNKKVKALINNDQIWADKNLTYYLEKSVFHCEYEIRSSRSFRYKDFLWNGDNISILKQW